jgi:flagellar M-ring protein FliF
VSTFIETLRSLGPVRLAAMAMVAAGILAFFIFLTGRLASPEMALLYAELDSQDSGQIVSRLEQMNMAYRMSGDGSQIFVPADQVARLRVAMAEDGLPSGGSIGYEIFDRTEGLGTTNFVQNINHLRALEGELARTIRSIALVRLARVHLVLPRRELFSRDRQEPSASIVLTMRGGRRLSGNQVLAVQHMVAAAVPGLQPSMVSIVDNKGTLLARGTSPDDPEGFAGTAEEMRIAYEARLARTIEELIERSVGRGNVRAEVSADMDFDRVTENAEIYDPDGQVARSTQTVEQNSNALDGQVPPPVTVGNNLPDAGLPQLGDGGSSTSQTSRVEETVNYEITRTVKTHVRESGLVRRLSVAVLVNGTTRIGANDEPIYEPRSEEEMDRFAALVRSAVGLSDERGDTLEIANLRFADLEIEPSGEATGSLLGFDTTELMRVAEILVLGVVGILVLLLVVRPVVGRLLESIPASAQDGGDLLSDMGGSRPALAGPGGHPAGALTGGAAPGATAAVAQPTGGLAAAENVESEVEAMIDLNKVEGRVRASSIHKIGEIVDKHPEEAVAIVRNWIYQED